VHDLVTVQKATRGRAHSESCAKQKQRSIGFRTKYFEDDASSHRFHFLSVISHTHADKQDERL
jgi:hypothetical protein